MFGNIPNVTKNLLLLNILFYISSLMMQSNGIPVYEYLSGRYLNSPYFEPYQVVTHMFMHSPTDFFHIIFNMLLLVMFGSHLERIWGAKRYFIFYVSCGLGAFFLYNSIGVWQLMQLKQELVSYGYNISKLNNEILDPSVTSFEVLSEASRSSLKSYLGYSNSSLVGASGAIFGLLAGFAILFPNTELMLLFLPVPIKAKYLIGGYLAYEVYKSIYYTNDHIAHLAHVGGAIVGIVMVLYWRKSSKNFY